MEPPLLLALGMCGLQAALACSLFVLSSQGEHASGWAVKRLVVAKELVGRLAEKLGGGVTLEVLATAKVGVVPVQLTQAGHADRLERSSVMAVARAFPSNVTRKHPYYTCCLP